MDYEVACEYVKSLDRGISSRRVSVKVPIRTGSHHKITIFERTSEGKYIESWSDRYLSHVRAAEIKGHVGDIVCQRTTSPARAGILERYGIILDEHHVDWGVESDWLVDFGPMGEVTRRGLRSTSYQDIKRPVVSQNKETTGG